MEALNGRTYEEWNKWLENEMSKPLSSHIEPIEYSRVLAALQVAIEKIKDLQYELDHTHDFDNLRY